MTGPTRPDPAGGVQIALFDLDHTLIPFDSGGTFARFLIDHGALDADFEARYLDYCRQYAAGTVDMVGMHRFTVRALGVHAPDALARWLSDFEASIAPQVPEAARALVREHQDAGHLCALVTATTRFVAESFGRALGLADVLATEPAVDAAGRYTGEVVGVPCFHDAKRVHVERWLAHRGLHWDDVARSWFYSDSINDLPLLQAVTDPVAVNPDAKLLAHAMTAGWPVRRIGSPRRIAAPGPPA